MREEHKALAPQTALCHSGHPVALHRHLPPGCMLPLSEHPVVVGGTGRLHFNTFLKTLLIKAVEYLFIRIGGYLILSQILTSSSGYQQKGMKSHRTYLLCQVHYLIKLMRVKQTDGSVYLILQANFTGRFSGGDDRIEGTGDSTEGIVGLSIGPVKAQTNPPYTRFLHCPGTLSVYQRSAGGGGHPQAQRSPVFYDRKKIRTGHRFSARKNDNRRGKGGHSIEDPITLFCRQFVCVSPVCSLCPAVFAIERAGPGDLPGHNPQSRCFH